jgi:hypothetical protein
MNLVAIPTYLKDPIEARHSHAAVNTAVVVESIASTWERNASVPQMAYTLLVLPVNEARTKRGP